MTEVCAQSMARTFDSPAAVEALHFYYKLVKEVSPIARGRNRSRRNGKIAMSFTYLNDKQLCSMIPCRPACASAAWPTGFAATR